MLRFFKKPEPGWFFLDTHIQMYSIYYVKMFVCQVFLISKSLINSQIPISFRLQYGINCFWYILIVHETELNRKMTE